MKKIDKFKDEYGFLSNFRNALFEYEGLIYNSVEAAFQSMKLLDKEKRKIFQHLSPRDAKRQGRKVELRPDWEEVKVSIMRDLIYKKFKTHIDLKIELLDTGNAELIEGNTWGDTFWGVCNGEGKNILGKILMDTREKLREEQ